MDIENHTKVYLPNGVVVDASRKAGRAYRKEMEYQIAGNKVFAQVLRTGFRGPQEDQRILRVARLLDQLNGQERALCDLTDELFDICDEEQLRYVGSHPRLECLMKDVRFAADFVDEYAKRVGLWLEHLRLTGAQVSDIVSISLAANASKQRDMTTGLVWSAAMANPAGKIRPPGPGKLPYGPPGAPNPEKQEPRKYKDGKPVPIAEKNPVTGNLQPLNWRYDPDIRYPTPYNKFLRFDGPYFSPIKPKDPAALNEFFLPASLVQIRDYYIRRYDQCKNNLKTTGRLPEVIRTPQEEVEYQEQQKLLEDSLALSTGENYDRFSIVGEIVHDEPVENATKPYVWVRPGTTERQVNFGSGTGKFKPEDLNRAMKGVEDIIHHVPTVDHGRRIFMKRDIENAEVLEADQRPEANQ